MGFLFLYHRVQTDPRAHPASYPMVARGSHPKGKAAGAWNWLLTSIKWGYTSTPPVHHDA